ncbi:MAG: hypothetical protein WAT71_10195 [Ignavibacteria bacterium]
MKKLILIFIVLSLNSINVFADRTFNGPGNFRNAALWGGVLPGTGDNLIIQGECIFDIQQTYYDMITLSSNFPYGIISWEPGSSLELICNSINSTSTNTAVDMTNGGKIKINIALNLAEETLIPGAGKVTITPGLTFPLNPLTFNDLTVSGFTYLSSSITVNGVLDLSFSGNYYGRDILNLREYNLILGDNSSVIRYGFPGGFIQTPGNGSVFRKVGNIPFEFPVGSERVPGTNYMSISSITISNLGIPDIFKVSCIRGFTNPVPENAINLEWKVEEATPGGSIVTFTCDWYSFHETGPFNHNIPLTIARYDGTNWLEKNSYNHNTVDPYKTTASGFTSFGAITVKNRSNTKFYISTIPEGLFDLNSVKLNLNDTIKAYLRNSTSPFVIVDSVTSVIDSLSFTGMFEFTKALTGTYYLILKNRNCLETWSKSGGEYLIRGDSLNYDFTISASQAYGNNQKLIGNKYCLFSGEVNSDGTIDLSDMALIDNDAANFISGYSSTDLNGDNIVDLSDMAIVNNNSANFVSVVRP